MCRYTVSPESEAPGEEETYETYIPLSLAEPDPLRLRYRLQLHELVADIVRNKRSEVLQTIEQFAEKHIDEQNRSAFTEMLQDEIKRLHPGIIARYRLRPAEFAAWKETRKL